MADDQGAVTDIDVPLAQNTDVFLEAVDELTEAARFSLEENKFSTRRKLRGFMTWVIETFRKHGDELAALRARVEELEQGRESAQDTHKKPTGKTSASAVSGA